MALNFDTLMRHSPDRTNCRGYVVLQYDLPGSLLKKIVADADEIQFAPSLLDWLVAQSRDPVSGGSDPA